MSTKERIFDDGLASDYPVSLYQTSRIADGIDSFDSMTSEHIAQFFDQGYLVIHNAFTPAEVHSAVEGLRYLISGEHPDFNGIMFEQASKGVDVVALSAEEKQDYVRKFMWFVQYDERLEALSEHPKLINAIRQIIGEEPELFQDMALIKPPKIGREKPWHQDHAYFELPLRTTVVGAWIALDEATIENGCMVVNPGSNRQGPVVHFQRRDWQICDTDIQNQGAVAVPLQPGGCLLFHSLTQHGTPANHTDMRRRALQFHYKPATVAKSSKEERLAIFGSEGKDVTC